MIIIKTPSEIDLIRESCEILVETFKEVEGHLKPGISTKEIDRIAEKYIHSRGGIPSFKGFHGFPAAVCISIDEQVVHGFPGKRHLEEGQIVGIDMGVIYKGYYSDAARTYPIGKVSELKKKLMDVTKEALWRGIEQARVGNRVSDISYAVQTYVESFGFSVVRELVGHGVGKDVWEEPQIPNYGKPGKGPRLRAGMVIAIEPMVNAATYEVRTESDNWTVVTADGKPSAHFEHTIALFEDHTEVLTEGI
ncbi:methionine aminopeptidase 1 [bacterium BMS3Abin05]|nr:methionine aminopeptidase 1 [bacterium BMS3Abin05]GBE28647.1 methionine aminopeptidase 1 [bacterium BMS3Bbin03]HDL78911.1 type I methionyl aminopeptidase [Bacteroidota bacterium]HDZ11721.1 type I methionyl aminopeptidase [Bacteroidota bacterium]